MAGLLNMEVPGGLTLWDYVKQRANDPLVPPPTSSMIQQDMLNKGLSAVGMAPVGMTAIKLSKVAPNVFEYVSDPAAGPVSKWVFKKNGKSGGYNATRDGQEVGDAFDNLDAVKGYLRWHYYGD